MYVRVNPIRPYGSTRDFGSSPRSEGPCQSASMHNVYSPIDEGACLVPLDMDVLA